jgi:hypothetical protein
MNNGIMQGENTQNRIFSCPDEIFIPAIDIDSFVFLKAAGDNMIDTCQILFRRNIGGKRKKIINSMIVLVIKSPCWYILRRECFLIILSNGMMWYHRAGKTLIKDCLLPDFLESNHKLVKKNRYSKGTLTFLFMELCFLWLI